MVPDRPVVAAPVRELVDLVQMRNRVSRHERPQWPTIRDHSRYMMVAIIATSTANTVPPNSAEASANRIRIIPTAVRVASSLIGRQTAAGGSRIRPERH